MSGKIENKFAELKSADKKALIPYLTCGFPSHGRFVDCSRLLEDCGADMIEIGIPHSDPMADGPTIKRTSHQALSKGLTTDNAFSLIEKVAARTSIPLIAMCYINTILKPGAGLFASRCRTAGISGIIIPDLTFEERERLSGYFTKNQIDMIFLTAPTTPVNRVREIAAASEGYLYLVSVTGITGARKSLPASTETFIRKAKAVSPVPVCVGFGISNEATARRMGRLADGIIVGSALLNRIESAANSRRAFGGVSSLMKELRRGLDR
jgi:tryptophan synthase alpha chain